MAGSEILLISECRILSPLKGLIMSNRKTGYKLQVARIGSPSVAQRDLHLRLKCPVTLGCGKAKYRVGEAPQSNSSNSF